MEHFQIISARKSDREEILRLYKSQLGREFCPWTDLYPEIDNIDFDIAENNLFVMKDGCDKIISAISVENDEDIDELPFWDNNLNPAAALCRLAVLPEEQNKGYARKMIIYTMGVLKERGYKAVRMLVNKQNIKALNSYSHLEFNYTGECEMYEQIFSCFEKEL